MANSTTIYSLNDGRAAVDVDFGSKTLDLSGCGLVQNVVKDAIVLTLPATTAGASYTIRNGGVPASTSLAGSGSNGSTIVTVSPNSSDKIQGFGLSAQDDKDLINTKVTANVGDEIQLTGDGTDGWILRVVKGTWVRET